MNIQVSSFIFFREGSIGQRLLHYPQDRDSIVNIWFREEETLEWVVREIAKLDHPEIRTFHNLSIFKKYCNKPGRTVGEAFIFYFSHTEHSLQNLMALQKYLKGNSTYLLGLSFQASYHSDKVLGVEDDGLIVQENVMDLPI